MRVLGLIPARGGSKGIPRKNVRLLGGRPLLAYTIERALGARRLDRVVLSTDDEDIARLGRRLGVDVPFLRPAELAADETPMIDVLRHALTYCAQQGDLFDALCLLQPTSPFRAPGLIDRCIDLFAAQEADCVVTVQAVPHTYNPHWVYFLSPEGALHLATGEEEPIPRRQDLPPAYHRDGQVYVSRSRRILEDRTIYGPRTMGVPAGSDGALNLDTMDDWKRAEAFLAARGT